MLHNLLTSSASSLPEGGKDIGVGEAAIYALIGLAVVFVGIAFLIFIVWAVGKLMEKVSNKPQKDVSKKAEATAPVEAANEEEISEETIAVIMAALTAYYQTNNPKCEFTLKRIKRM